MRSEPLVSIVIPTKNSEKFIGTCLRSIQNQACPKDLFEVIVVDNESRDKTKLIANEFGAIFVEEKGSSPRVCQQRNLGAKIAKGRFVYFLDHDMELDPNLIVTFYKQSAASPHIGAWYVFEKIISYNPIMKLVRNFENLCTIGSPIAAARIIRKDIFLKTEGYDINLSRGPADWDMDIQLKLNGCNFEILKDTYVWHHEESLTFGQYIGKKANYVLGAQIYKRKWRQNKKVYEGIVKKQFSAFYRIFTVCFERGNWKKTLLNFPSYLLLVLVTFLKGVQYLLNK